MRITRLHEWDITIGEAKAVQERLKRRIRLEPIRLAGIKYVAGADIAVSKKLDQLVAAVVILTFPRLETVEIRTARARTPFPYVPGFLSFREIPVLIRCFGKTTTPFDVILCDGQGIAHPRRFGLASHLGLTLNVPAVGCAKSRLVGEYNTPGISRGNHTRLIYRGKQVGNVLRTRDGVKPLFVSPGFRTDFAGSRNITLSCLTRFRLPEPTRLAHIEAGKKKLSIESDESL